jgi:ActR/RegA family two-component response regulator
MVGRELDSSPPAVLWIDDQVRSGDIDVCSLESEGLAVDCAETGRDGLRLAQARAFDAILLDVRLGDESGLDVLEQFTDAGVTAPIVILTGFAEVDTAVAAMKLGAADYRTKPVEAEEIASLVRTLIAHPDRQRPGDVSHLGEVEWLRTECDRLAACVTRRQLIALMLRVLLNRRLGLTAFFGCAEALRLALTPSAEMSVTLLASDMRHAILHGARTPRPQHPKLREALETLERDGSKVSQNMFAGRVGLSRAYLCRLLTAQTNRTPSEWCRGAVMRVALRQFLQTTEQISQIAYEAGYEHPSQFDLHFETTFGASPTELRHVFTSQPQLP